MKGIEGYGCLTMLIGITEYKPSPILKCHTSSLANYGRTYHFKKYLVDTTICRVKSLAGCGAQLPMSG